MFESTVRKTFCEIVKVNALEKVWVLFAQEINVAV